MTSLVSLSLCFFLTTQIFSLALGTIFQEINHHSHSISYKTIATQDKFGQSRSFANSNKLETSLGFQKDIFLRNIVSLSTTYYVDNIRGSDGNTGTSPNTPKQTIQNAINAASTGDIISIVATSRKYDPIQIEGKTLTIICTSGIPTISQITLNQHSLNDRLIVNNDLQVDSIVFNKGLIYTEPNARIILTSRNQGFYHNGMFIGDNISHIVGQVTRTVQNNFVEYPIGTENAYRPVSLRFTNILSSRDISILHVNRKPSGLVGLPIKEGISQGIDVARFADFYWIMRSAPSLSAQQLGLFSITASGFTDFEDVDHIRVISRNGDSTNSSAPWSQVGLSHEYNNYTRNGIPTIELSNSRISIPESGAIFTFGLPSAIGVYPPSLNFGVVRVGSTAVDSCILTNRSSNSGITINLTTNNPTIFRLTNSLTEINPSASKGVVVQFTPRAETTYYDTLTISSETSGIVKIGLSGTGVSPPPPPRLISPIPNQSNVSLTPTFSWESLNNATSYRLQLSTNTNFSPVIKDSTLSLTSCQVGTLQTNTQYYWRVRSINIAGASGWSEEPNYRWFRTVARPNPPSLSQPADRASNQPTTISLSWNPVSNATYRLQVSTSQTFSPLIINDSTLTTTSKRIENLAYNSTYYWRVTSKNAVGESDPSEVRSFRTVSMYTPSSPISIPYPENPTSSTSYRLVSIPNDDGSITVGDILASAGNQRTDWRVFRDNGSDSNFLEELSATSRLNTGEGYWIVKKGTLTISRSINMPSLQPDGTFTIGLHRGWNIIGNPFDRAVQWSDVRSANSQIPPSIVPLAYDGTYRSTTTLEPFTGYYFENFNTGLTELKIPYPFTSRKVTEPQLPQVEWMLQLIFKSDINEDSENYLGIAPTASDEQDVLDTRKPSLFLDQGFLYFDRPQWDEEFSRFSRDFRSSLGDGQAWEFEVSNPRLSQASVIIRGIEQLPSGYEAILIDRINTTCIDIKTTREYVFQTVREKTPFVLVVGKTPYIKNIVQSLHPGSFELTQNFPNPFNPSTSIRFRLHRNAKITIEIYSAVGQRVRTLLENMGYLPGTYNIRWDSRDDRGIKVASGVYFYRLTLDGKESYTKTMLLLR